MDNDLSPKELASATGLSERTIRRRLALYRRAVVDHAPVPVATLRLAIPYRHRLGVPYRIPAEVAELLRRAEAIA